MFQHPEVALNLAHQRERELIAEADRQRRLTRILHANMHDERDQRVKAKPPTLHPLVFWALR